VKIYAWMLAVGVLVAAIVLASRQADRDPVFTCGAGKHWEMRYVDGVATLACFE